jgi:predicted ABC-type ATPase
MQSSVHDKPEIIVFAGPNGSGKSTITRMAKTVGQYINADDIKLSNHCSDLEAARIAEELREQALSNCEEFTFETVLSTDRNLDLLRRAKDKGYFIRCIYVLTENSEVNVIRVMAREEAGGHGVPEDKIKSRYDKALKHIPELVKLCDIMHIYDNTSVPYRIFKKRKDVFFKWENEYWTEDKITALTGINEFSEYIKK